MATLATRKLYKLGKARAITVPETWLRWVEQRVGLPLEVVRIETFDDRLVVWPDWSSQEKKAGREPFDKG